METIDSNIWITQQRLANELGTTVQRVHNWIKREKIESKFIPELNITLVNRLSINIKTVNN
jgi:hypothetical protein